MAKSQVQKFRDAARQLEADESEKGFDEAMRKIGRQRPKDEKESARKPAPTKDRSK
jgi:hypothetical protein